MKHLVNKVSQPLSKRTFSITYNVGTQLGIQLSERIMMVGVDINLITQKRHPKAPKQYSRCRELVIRNECSCLKWIKLGSFGSKLLKKNMG